MPDESEKKQILVITATIDKNRKVKIHRVPGDASNPTIIFEFWNGECQTRIRLSDLAILAACAAYQELINSEATSKNGNETEEENA